MSLKDLTVQLSELQQQLNTKESELCSYVNTHEVPGELRSILLEWAEIKNQMSDKMSEAAIYLETSRLNWQRPIDDDREYCSASQTPAETDPECLLPFSLG